MEKTVGEEKYVMYRHLSIQFCITLQLISIYIQAMIQTEKCVKVAGEESC